MLSQRQMGQRESSRVHSSSLIITETCDLTARCHDGWNVSVKEGKTERQREEGGRERDTCFLYLHGAGVMRGWCRTAQEVGDLAREEERSRSNLRPHPPVEICSSDILSFPGGSE